MDHGLQGNETVEEFNCFEPLDPITFLFSLFFPLPTSFMNIMDLWGYLSREGKNLAVLHYVLTFSFTNSISFHNPCTKRFTQKIPVQRHDPNAALENCEPETV